MRFATIAALGALAVVNAEYVPECGEYCMWPLPTQLVDSKCYGTSYYTLNEEEMTKCFKAKMAMQMACGEQPGSPICQQEAARVKAGGPVDLKKKQEIDFGDFGNFSTGGPTELVDESCYNSDQLSQKPQEEIDQCVQDMMSFAIGCMFNDTNDVCVEQAARDAARNAPLILKKKQEGDIDLEAMFDFSSLFPAPEKLVDQRCTDPMEIGQLSQEEMDQCAQDIAAFALACAFNEGNELCKEQKDIDEFGRGKLALMSQSAATCEETSVTRDVGLSAAMVAIGALATYGIMRRAKTTDDFQRV